MSDQEWLQDINNWMEGPDDVDINSLLERADQLTQITPETLQEVFSEEVMPAEEVAGIARELATQSDDLFTKLAFLQSPLGLWEVWGKALDSAGITTSLSACGTSPDSSRKSISQLSKPTTSLTA